MTSLRHNDESAPTAATEPGPPSSDDRFLDAAREAILAVGWSRTTLTDIARRAGVSRMTLYRRWPDTQTLLADLMTREWGHVVASSAAPGTPAGSAADPVGQVVDGVLATVRGLRANPLLRRILDVDPQLLLPYLLDRRGRSQQQVLDVLVGLLTEGQRSGHVRAGDADILARSLVLACHGFVLSAHTMVDTGPDAGSAAGSVDASTGGDPLDPLDAELAVLVERFLRA